MGKMILLNLLPPTFELNRLPLTLPLETKIRIELEEGVPVMRASTTVQKRIQLLIQKEREATLTAREQKELTRYEQLDDYLSFINRMVRNLVLNPKAVPTDAV